MSNHIQRIEDLIRIARFIKNVSESAQAPAELTQRANEILTVFNINRSQILSLINIVSNNMATLDNRLRALDVLGDIIQRGIPNIGFADSSLDSPQLPKGGDDEKPEGGG